MRNAGATVPSLLPKPKLDTLLALNSRKADDKADIQFHYNVSNAFYRLFLDAGMLYSCAYFATWHDDIDKAQTDSLDMICRKLRLKSYSEMAGPYDKIASIGMYENVVFKNHTSYFRAVHRLLRPGGLYLHQAITRRGRCDMRACHRKKPEYQAMTR